MFSNKVVKEAGNASLFVYDTIKNHRMVPRPKGLSIYCRILNIRITKAERAIKYNIVKLKVPTSVEGFQNNLDVNMKRAVSPESVD